MHACHLSAETETRACFSETAEASAASWEHHAAGAAIPPVQDMVWLIAVLDA